MTTAVRRVATTWLRHILAKAAPDPLFEKFLAEKYQGGRARVPNPNPKTRDRYREVAVSTALRDQGFLRQVQVEFERWKGSKKDEPKKPEKPKTEKPEAPPPAHTEHPRWLAAQDALLKLATEGTVIADVPVTDEGLTANQVRKRRLQSGDKTADFVWKGQEGEGINNRIGIQRGTYHQREAAAYNVDRLFGEGTVVPPTHTNGEGSYQEFANGAQSLLDVFDPIMPVEDLADHPDFHRINVVDAILGHEDRHPGNIMFVKDSSKPGGHRFIAIDNGFALADPTEKIDMLAWQVKDPWSGSYDKDERVEAMKAVKRSTQNIDRDLHEQIQNVDHEAFVRAMVGTGMKERKALLAALVRLSAIQRDRKIMGSFEGEHHPYRHLGAQQEFQHMAAKEPKKLLAMAGDGPSFDELRSVVDRVLA